MEDLSHPGGNARTLRIHGSASTAVLKTYRSARTFRQELRAYRDWVPALAETPRLIDHRREPPPALLLQALPGEPVSSASLPVEAERRLHGRAGRWLRALHAVPFRDPDPVPLEEGYRRRILAWDEATVESIDAELRGWLHERLHDLPSRLRGASRVPCHLDFEPRNWLVDEDGRWVGVIDFEHARPDHPLADLARLAAYVWPARADLARGFLDEYGAPSGAADVGAVDRLALFEVARRLAWATDHGDANLIRSARAALAARGAPVGS
jgi:aminoglycoside phosphotransferase (APT) family kinase protein